MGSTVYPPATTTTATVHDGCDYTPGPGGYSQTMIPLGDGREILQMVPVDGRIQYSNRGFAALFGLTGEIRTRP